jgi:hypothetical protein
MNSAACLRREVLRSLRNRKLILRAEALVFAGVASIGHAYGALKAQNGTDWTASSMR